MSIPVFIHRFYLYIHPVTQVFIKIEKHTWNSDLCATVTIKWTHRKKTTTKRWRPRKQAQQQAPLKAMLTWTHAFHTLLTLCSSAIPSHCTKRPINENASLGIFKNKHPETTNGCLVDPSVAHKCKVMNVWALELKETEMEWKPWMIPCDGATFGDFVSSVWMTLGWKKVRVCQGNGMKGSHP